MHKVKLFAGFLGFVATLLFLNPVFADEFSWRLKSDQKGIKVYTRKVEGYSTKEFLGVTEVKDSLAHVVTLFEDADRFHKWMYRCKEFKEIERKSPSERLFYFRQGLPWPIKERDTVIRFVRTEDPRTKVVSYALTDVPNMYPEREKTVRMPDLKGLWRIIPKENDTVELQYQLLRLLTFHKPLKKGNKITTADVAGG